MYRENQDRSLLKYQFFVTEKMYRRDKRYRYHKKRKINEAEIYGLASKLLSWISHLKQRYE